MRALRFYGAKDLRLDEIDEPAISKGKVKVSLHLLTPLALLGTVKLNYTRSNQSLLEFVVLVCYSLVSTLNV